MLERRRGEIAVLLSCLLGSVFPVIAILSFSAVSPLFSAALSTLVAAAFFAALVARRCGAAALLRRPAAWQDILLTSLYIGVAFHSLFFIGLRFTTAGNAAILLLLEVFFSFLILGLILRHEPMRPRQLLGAFLMVAGAAVVLLPNVSGLRWGDFLVVLATAFGPLGNKHAQAARKSSTAEEIMFWRSMISGCVLLVLACGFESWPSGAGLCDSFWYLAVNGVLIFGLSKILWIEGIHLIPITIAISLLSVSPVFTLAAAYFALEEPVTVFQVCGLPFLGAGVIMLTKKTAGLPVEAGL